MLVVWNRPKAEPRAPQVAIPLVRAVSVELREVRYAVEASGTATTSAVRGGSWSAEPKTVRSATRGELLPTWLYDNFGFRLARTPPR